MRIECVAGQATMFGPDLDAGRMCPEPTAPQEGKTSERSWKRSYGSKNHNFMLLDLRPGAGNILGPYWEINPVWLGQPGIIMKRPSTKGSTMPLWWMVVPVIAEGVVEPPNRKDVTAERKTKEISRRLNIEDSSWNLLVTHLNCCPCPPDVKNRLAFFQQKSCAASSNRPRSQSKRLAIYLSRISLVIRKVSATCRSVYPK